MSDQPINTLRSLTESQIMRLMLPKVRAQAEEILREGNAAIYADPDGTTLRGLVEYNGLHEAEISVRGNNLLARCSCGYKGPGCCPHVGALFLYLTEDRDQADEDLVLLESQLLPNLDQEDEYRHSLEEQPIKTLRAIAREHGIPIKGTRKDAIAEAIANWMQAPGRMRSILYGLNELQQDLLVHLHLILSFGYGMLQDQIAERWSERHPEMSLSALQEQVTKFHHMGLLLTFGKDKETYYLMPGIVRTNLPPQPRMLPPSETEPKQIHTQPPAFILQKLYSFWNTLVAGNAHGKEPLFRMRAAPQRLPIEDQLPQLQKWRHLRSELEQLSGRRNPISGLYGVALTVPPAPYHLRSSDRKTMRKHTRCTDEEIEFFCALLESLGAIYGQPGEPIAVSTDRFQAFMEMPPTAQLKLLSLIWLSMSSWSEVDMVLRATDEIRLRRNLIYLSYEPVHLYEEWTDGRRTVYRFLYVLTEGSWVSLEQFLRLIYDTYPNLFHDLSEAGVWWVESTKSKKQFGTDFDDWRQGFGRFVTAVLTGPTYWLGMLDLGYEDGEVKAIRLTPIGSYLIGRRDTFSQEVTPGEARDAVRLGEDMTLSLVPSTAPAQLHELLHRIGKLDKITPDHFTYRITADGVLAEIGRGRDLEELISELQKLCKTGLPDAWKEQMRTWVRNYGQLHLYDDISLIELADDYALQELKVNTSLSEHIVHQFSPRLIAIRSEAIEALIQEMEKKGYTPRVTE